MFNTMEQRRIAEAFADTNMLATSLLTLVLDIYGEQGQDEQSSVMNWEWDTLVKELHDDLGVVLPEANAEKLQALMTALTTDLFYRDWVVFHHICSVLSGDTADFDYMRPTDPHEMAWGVFEAVMVDGDGNPQFTDEVRRYIGASLSWAGVFNPPDVLRMADYPPGDSFDDHAGTLTDDPELYAGFHAKSKEDATGVDDYVRDRFKLLIDQVNGLPLRRRNKEAWDKLVEKLQRNDRRLTASSSPR